MATEINNIVCEKCNTMYRYDASRILEIGAKLRDAAAALSASLREKIGFEGGRQ